MLQWGGQTFSTPQEFARWLAARGQRFQDVVAQHPGIMSHFDQAPAQQDPYAGAIGSEGTLQSQLAQLSAQDIADRSGLTSSIGRAVGDYGAVPAGYQDAYGALSPEIRRIAESNPFSFLAQENRGVGQQIGAMKANRAARGVIQGGGTALATGNINYDSGLRKYTGLRNLLDTIGGAESTYANSVRSRYGDQAGAYGDAISRLLGAGFSPGGAGGAPGGAGGAGGAQGVPSATGAPAAAPQAPGTPGADSVPNNGYDYSNTTGRPTGVVGQKNKQGFIVAPPAGTGDPNIEIQRQQAIKANSKTYLSQMDKMMGRPAKIQPWMGADRKYLLNDQWTKFKAGDKRWWV
jgi:hypothetical protein